MRDMMRERRMGFRFLDGGVRNLGGLERRTGKGEGETWRTSE